MTIKQAREKLGKLAENLSDEELSEEIKVAELLKNIFFCQYQNQYGNNYNKINGKT